MRVLLLSESSYPDHLGGAGKCAHLLGAALARRGHRITLLCGTGGDTNVTSIDGVEVHRVSIAGLDKVRDPEAWTATRLATHLRKHGPGRFDVVHDVGAYLSYYYPLANYLCGRDGSSYVVQFQFLNLIHRALCDPGYEPLDVEELMALSRITESTQCLPTRYADCIICVSHQEAAYLQRLYRPGTARIELLPNPVDTTHYNPGAARRWRRDLGLEDRRLVLFGGRIEDPMKGAAIVARAFRRARAVEPRLHLVLLGSEHAAASVFGDSMEAVTCLGWIKEAPIVARALAMADMVVMPSIYEPFGMMCAEAMNAAVPVIVSPVGGLPEMIRHGIDGLVIAGRNPTKWPHELAAAMIRLARAPLAARQMGANGRRRSEALLNSSRVAGRLERIYAKLGTHGKYSPPRWTAADRERYISLVRTIAGADARAVARRRAAAAVSDEDRCLKCRRSRLATDHLGLLQVGQTGANDLERRLEVICPLGLLQRRPLKQVP